MEFDMSSVLRGLELILQTYDHPILLVYDHEMDFQ